MAWEHSGASCPSPPYQAVDGWIDDPPGNFLKPDVLMLMTPICPLQDNDAQNQYERQVYPFFSAGTKRAASAPKKLDMMADVKPFPKPTAPWPWSRRKVIWDPPTALDLILDSPIRAFISFIYAILLSLRGAPFKPARKKPTVRVVCISDTHTNKPDIPNADLLIHAGDCSNSGTVEEIQAQIDWLDSLPQKEKIMIAGNHDSYFDPRSRKLEDKGKKLNFRGLHYLQNQSITLKFKGGRKLTFYGSPDIPQCGGSDFA
jgi:hypothetical protein